MPLTPSELQDAADHLKYIRDKEHGRLHWIRRFLDDKVTGPQAGIYVPEQVTREYRLLVDQARFNVLPLVVTTVAQNLFVEGFQQMVEGGSPESALRNAPVWEAVWQPNRMDARQAGIFRAAITYGVSYATALPGQRGGAGDSPPESVPVITPYSPLDLTAAYTDHINDEWPDLAMVTLGTSKRNGQRYETVELYDDEYVWRLEVYGHTVVVVGGEPMVHGLGVTPVVRFQNRFELENSRGKVEPLIPLQRQLNQTTFSLLMAQQYGAFRQRYVTGLEVNLDENGNPIQPFRSAVNTLMISEDDRTQFGEFSQTDLGGYLNSRDKTILHIASVAQIPPHNLLTGSGISNISAEALAALEAAHRQDIAEHQHSLGESMEQLLRLAGLAMDDQAIWEDTSAQVRWGDTTPRSLAQVADALGKLATLLQIPVRALWEMVPGATEQTVQRWEALASEADLLLNINDAIDGAIGALDAEPPSEPTDQAA